MSRDSLDEQSAMPTMKISTEQTRTNDRGNTWHLAHYRKGKLRPIPATAEGLPINGSRYVIIAGDPNTERCRRAIAERVKETPGGVRDLRATSDNVQIHVCTVPEETGQGVYIERAVIAANQDIWRLGREYLTIFVSAKTHKPDIPLRSIVFERGCWQKLLAFYFQKHLSSTDLPHPYRVRDSLDVIDFLRTKHADHDLNLFSLDIEDMYYNLDIKILLNSVSEAIEMHGATRFQNASGISTGGFLDLLRLYLRSSLNEYEVFIQRSECALAPASHRSLVRSFSSSWIGRCRRILLAPVLNAGYSEAAGEGGHGGGWDIQMQLVRGTRATADKPLEKAAQTVHQQRDNGSAPSGGNVSKTGIPIGGLPPTRH
ncbi:hypothetical protein HPB47_003284 [Ixodes persulcatus]|uniref:Uncharacterized protein n=1 Tax=Ixodes persulcatus TaxID=34615 RepID=A0AC60PIV8_IXOPE|nr:hypothetical protein HPB47_003284 [Ixodes persulcatus]